MVPSVAVPGGSWWFLAVFFAVLGFFPVLNIRKLPETSGNPEVSVSFRKFPEVSGSFWKFWKLWEDSRSLQKFQKFPETSRNFPETHETSRSFQNFQEFCMVPSGSWGFRGSYLAPACFWRFLTFVLMVPEGLWWFPTANDFM